ncbi:MAG: hypothetical protein ACFFA3_13950 [Promethearchaeota archaeon]
MVESYLPSLSNGSSLLFGCINPKTIIAKIITTTTIPMEMLTFLNCMIIVIIVRKYHIIYFNGQRDYFFV